MSFDDELKNAPGRKPRRPKMRPRDLLTLVAVAMGAGAAQVLFPCQSPTALRGELNDELLAPSAEASAEPSVKPDVRTDREATR